MDASMRWGTADTSWLFLYETPSRQFHNVQVWQGLEAGDGEEMGLRTLPKESMKLWFLVGTQWPCRVVCSMTCSNVCLRRVVLGPPHYAPRVTVEFCPSTWGHLLPFPEGGWTTKLSHWVCNLIYLKGHQ